jgi:hypothetical protein
MSIYVYQADPELYKTGAGLGIFKTVRVHAYQLFRELRYADFPKQLNPIIYKAA